MSKNALADIKRRLDAHIGQKITLRASGGRKKTIERMGVLEETYSSVFTVKLDKDHNTVTRVSYSYADVLTASVEVLVMDDGSEQYIKLRLVE
jgi:uncharacterized protein Veg